MSKRVVFTGEAGRTVTARAGHIFKVPGKRPLDLTMGYGTEDQIAVSEIVAVELVDGRGRRRVVSEPATDPFGEIAGPLVDGEYVGTGLSGDERDIASYYFSDGSAPEAGAAAVADEDDYYLQSLAEQQIEPEDQEGETGPREAPGSTIPRHQRDPNDLHKYSREHLALHDPDALENEEVRQVDPERLAEFVAAYGEQEDWTNEDWTRWGLQMFGTTEAVRAEGDRETVLAEIDRKARSAGVAGWTSESIAEGALLLYEEEVRELVAQGYPEQAVRARMDELGLGPTFVDQVVEIAQGESVRLNALKRV